MVQEESSKSGADSGASSLYFHADSAGSRTGSGASVTVVLRPFQVTLFASAMTSIFADLAESPVNFSVPPATSAVRTRDGPRTRTGPAEVSCRHQWAVSATSAISSSRPFTRTRASPLWV